MNAQIPVGGNDSHSALMHSGVFNVPCRPWRPDQSEAFRDCLPTAVGHTDVPRKCPATPSDWNKRKLASCKFAAPWPNFS